MEIDVPRARLEGPDGKTTEWRSAFQRRQAFGAQAQAGADFAGCRCGRHSDEAIAISVGVGGSTVYRTKRSFVVGNLEAAIHQVRFLRPPD